MKLLTKNTDYAVRAILHLAGKPDQFVSASAIAARECIPAPYLKRILQTLKKEKFLAAKEGVTGGVKLTRKPKDISLSEIIQLFQGELQLSECMFRKQLCPNRTSCALRSRIQGVERRLAKEFKGISMEHLLNDGTPEAGQ